MVVNNPISVLSAGGFIRRALLGNEVVKGLAKKVFPVITESAELPYIVYRRIGLEQVATKNTTGAFSALVEVVCYGSTYSESVQLAEAAREALDGKQLEYGDARLRGCWLSDSSESWESDAYIQSLIFTIRI